MKKKILLTLLVSMISIFAFGMISVSADAENDVIAQGGSWNSKWTLDKNGVLTITTDSDIDDYSYGSTPWHQYREQILEVVIDGRCERIGAYAFKDCTNLKRVQHKRVGEIGKSAFENCTSLESMFIKAFFAGEYYNRIEDSAFFGCTSLKEVSFSTGTPIGKWAFYGCTSLDSIYINELGPFSKYVKINEGEHSFYNITATIYYPRGCTLSTDIKTLSGKFTAQCSDFGTCGNDIKWRFDAENGTLILSGSGGPAEYSVGNETPWSAFIDEIKHIVVKDGITYLPSYIFEFCKQAEEITLPKTLEVCAYNAFNNCESVNNLIIPASLKEFALDFGFLRCTSLTDVYYVGTEEEFNNITNYEYATKNGQTIHYLVWNEKLPTCTEDGVEAHYTFDDTSVYDTKYDINKNVITSLKAVPATGHEYYKWTAEDWDNHKKECECGEIVIEPHEWGEGVVTTEPTHTLDGAKTYTCVCGVVKSEAIPAYKENHIYSEWIDEGDNHKKECECGDVIIEPHVWDAGVVTKEPTHIIDGTKTYTCMCGYVRVESVPAYKDNHSYSGWIQEKENHKKECECGDVITSPHEWDAGVVTAEPTHISDGTKTYRCFCGYVRTEVIPAYSEKHSYSGWIQEEDNHKKQCECGDAIIEPHEWDEGVITVEPTYETDGEKTYTCTVCGHAKTETIEKLVPEYTPGDINDDGEVNVRDVINLRRFITGGYGVEASDELADINKDGGADVRDVITLRRFIAGGYGIELK